MFTNTRTAIYGPRKGIGPMHGSEWNAHVNTVPMPYVLYNENFIILVY
jgi:hypothetical protein